MDEEIGARTTLDAVVTVADAKWLKDRLKDAPEAKNQIGFADIILLNKTDLVSAEELREVELRIRAINPYAKVYRTNRCDVEIKSLLGQGAFDLQRILEIEPAFLESDEHEHGHDHDHGHDHAHGEGHHHHGGLKHYHDEDMQSISLKTEKPLDPEKFLPWVNELSATEGPKILRLKGILSFKDDAQRFVLQGVHMVLDGDHQRDWKEGEKRDSRLVLIGRELDAKTIEQGFLACVA
jgi:G3E family GTPase